MIPVERVTEALGPHAMAGAVRRGEGERVRVRCLCGWESDQIPLGRSLATTHAAHQAGVLADAGLIPTQREWGVEYRAWTGAIYTEPAPLDEAERIVANDDQATLMSRWTGATEWESA